MSHCIENGILENCSCHDGNALGILLDEYKDKPYCASMNENVSVMLERMHCASEVSGFIFIHLFPTTTIKGKLGELVEDQFFLYRDD